MNCHTSGSRSPDGNGNPSRVAALSLAGSLGTGPLPLPLEKGLNVIFGRCLI